MTDCLVDGGVGAPGASPKFASGALHRRGLARALVATATVALFFALTATSFAAPHHSYTTSIGTSGTAESQFGTASPNGLAVDQGTGAVYVADTANSRIQKFDSSGTFVSAWGWGVDDGTGASQVCTSGCEAGISGSGAGQLASPTFVAVDNSGGASDGDVYVGDATNNTVTKFDSAGNYISANDGTGADATGTVFGPLAGIAVSTGGDLWVYDQNADMRKYNEAGNFQTQWNSGFGVTPAGIAIDASGNLYIVRGFPAVEKLDSTGVDLGELDGSGTATGLTVDDAAGQLLVTQGAQIAVYDTGCALPDCTPVETFGSPHLTGGAGITVRGFDGRAYVADPGNAELDVFDFGDPTIARTDPATTIHHTNAGLHGHLEPGGDPAITNCQFDWVDDAQFQVDGFTSASAVGCAEGDDFTAPADLTALLNNLTPGTTYHYRLDIVTTSSGDVTGQARSFTVPSFPLEGGGEIAAFGPDGTAATSFPSDLQPLAFNQGSRRLFAHDGGSPGIFGFDASAPPAFSPLASFAPLATAPKGNNAGLAIDNTALASAGNIYYASSAFGADGTGLIYGFDSSGAPLGGNFPIDADVNPGGAVGSPKSPFGVAVDPAGHLWVANLLSGRILEYSATGDFLGSVDVSAQGNPFLLAFDSVGNLYVSGGTTTRKYTAASGYTSSTEIDPNNAQALAVDPSTDDLYIAHGQSFSQYSSGGGLLGDFATHAQGVSFIGITVDAANHDVYLADDGNHKIRVFAAGTPAKLPTITAGSATAITATSATLNAKVDPEGIAVTDCHFDYVLDAQFRTDGFASSSSAPCVPDPGSGSGDVSVHADLGTLNPGSDYHFRIVASNANGAAHGADQTFHTPGPLAFKPTVSKVGVTTATLVAKVNPQSRSTSYQFQYATDAEFQANGFADAALAPVAPAAIGSGTQDLQVAERLTGLSPATIYHFRVVARNSVATVFSPGATFATYAAPPAFDPCPNGGFRLGAGAALPDCRAYEQSSPTNKNGNNIKSAHNGVQAAADGHAITFVVPGGIPGAQGGNQTPVPFVAMRGSEAWSTQGLFAPTDPADVAEGLNFTSNDLSVVAGTARMGRPSDRGYLGDVQTDSFQPIPTSVDFAPAAFSADNAKLVFEDRAALLPNAAPAVYNLYEYSNGAISLLGLIPPVGETSCDDDGAPVCVTPPGGSFAGPYDWEHDNTSIGGASQSGGAYFTRDTVSADASKVFFTEAGSGRLYMREDGHRTVQINASQASSPDPAPKPAAFRGATPDGSRVYFTSCERLTDTSTAVSTSDSTCGATNQGQDLYSYDTTSGDLVDLTVDATPSDSLGAAVRGFLGASADGSDVYFAANGVLAPGAVPGDCQGTNHRGACNLYHEHAGTITFLARLVPGSDVVAHQQLTDLDNWTGSGGGGNSFPHIKASRVAPGGALLFTSRAQLTSYDNTGLCARDTDDRPIPGPCAELYRYDPAAAPSDRLLCVSCLSTGAAPGENLDFEGLNAASYLPAFGAPYRTSNLSNDGNRAFFQTTDALVAADTNDATDVYEWEAPGTGTCTADGGCQYLISTGNNPHGAFIADASADGDDVFIFTDQQLVPQDVDRLVDVYDARVGGGLSSQHPVSPPQCSGDACQGLPSAPVVLPVAGSVTFAGAGNVPAGPGVPSTAKPKVSSRTVRGSTSATLSVKVPSRGRLTVSGSGLRRASAKATKAGTYKLRVTLSAKAQRAWKKAHVFRAKARVVFAPSNGAPATATVTVTFRTAKTTKKGR